MLKSVIVGRITDLFIHIEYNSKFDEYPLKRVIQEMRKQLCSLQIRCRKSLDHRKSDRIALNNIEAAKQ